MSGTRWQLFRLLGIPICVDASWLIILALLTWTLMNFFREAVPGLPPAAYGLLGAGVALAFFTCIVLHELGHAVVARATGLRVRGITLFLFGGVAELAEEPSAAGAEFLMAIAGPLVSAVLGGGFWLLASLGGAAGWPPEVVIALTYLAWINLTVLVFNLVPAFPLDGGRVLRAAMWGLLGSLRRATYWAALFGQGFACVLIGLGVLHFFAGQVFQGVWLGLIGLFLNNAARASYEQVLVRQTLGGTPVARLMTARPIVVPPELDLRQWVEDYVYRHHRKAFPVVSGDRLEGLISIEALSRYSRAEWDRHTVAEAMARNLEGMSIPPDADALQALAQMQASGSSRLLVVEGGRLLGIVSIRDLLDVMQLKLELEDGRDKPEDGSGAGPSRDGRSPETQEQTVSAKP
jgi:Zn-dependent protease/CBS domain-containing protein